MPHCTGAVSTAKASRYLQQLCKHFSHKVAVEYDAAAGRVEFPPGLCLMRAESGHLTLYCRSAEDRGLAVIRGIVDDHFVRFAWKEELTINWSDGLPDDVPVPVRAALAEG